MQKVSSNILKVRTFLIKMVLGMFFFFFCTITVLAQPDTGTLDNPGVDPDLIPIDGGLGFLLAAGVGYGVKKARDYRKKK